MARATQILAVTTLIGVATSVWLFLDNRSLRGEIADRPGVEATASSASAKPIAAADPWTPADRLAKAATPATATGPQPELPPEQQESRLDRRQRRLAEFSAMFGRQPGETEEEYKARIGPMITTGLAMPRMRVAEFRRIAEEKAGVSPDQSKKLDQAIDKMYDDVIDYTNKAVSDGLLSPYERNVAGWLDYAGGLGGMLNDAQGTFGKILSPDQLKTMQGAGFEWGEYLGVSAPWENLNAPPPAK